MHTLNTYLSKPLFGEPKITVPFLDKQENNHQLNTNEYNTTLPLSKHPVCSSKGKFVNAKYLSNVALYFRSCKLLWAESALSETWVWMHYNKTRLCPYTEKNSGFEQRVLFSICKLVLESTYCLFDWKLLFLFDILSVFNNQCWFHHNKETKRIILLSLDNMTPFLLFWPTYELLSSLSALICCRVEYGTRGGTYGCTELGGHGRGRFIRQQHK